MKNRNRQRENRRNKNWVGYYNHERYADPTAYQALNNIIREEKRTMSPAISQARA